MDPGPWLNGLGFMNLLSINWHVRPLKYVCKAECKVALSLIPSRCLETSAQTIVNGWRLLLGFHIAFAQMSDQPSVLHVLAVA